MSLYTEFETNADLENSGQVFQFTEESRVRMARAGGANKRYAKKLEAITRPHRRAIATESISREVSDSLMREAFAASVILDWETLVDGEWVQGILARDGSLHPFTPENVVKVLKDLPELFEALQLEAGKVANYRQDQLDGEAGN